MKRTRMVLVAAMLVLCSTQAQAAGEVYKGALLGLIPGAGHFYLERPGTGAIYALAGVGFITASIITKGTAEDAHDAYVAAEGAADYDGLWDDYESKKNVNHAMVACTFVTCLASSIHAAWIGKNVDWARFEVTPNGMEVCYDIKF